MKKTFKFSALLLIAMLCATIFVSCELSDAVQNDSSSALIVNASSFEICDNSLSLTLPNATESYSFLGKITVSTGATWQVSTDMQGLNSIPTKTVPLNVGDNTFYILVTSANGERGSLYTVTLRRRPIYTVSFDSNGGTALDPIEIEEGYTIAPDSTSRTGYIFAGWNYDFTQPIMGDQTVTASWTLNRDNTYSVFYDVNGGKSVDNPTSYKITDDITLNEPTWEYGRFLGWFTASNEKVTNLQGHTENLSLTAKWECYFMLTGNSITGLSSFCKQTVTSLMIPASLNGIAITSIGDRAFSGCSGLTSITIPNSVKSIGDYAFGGCSGLTSIIIPNSVTSIWPRAFCGCSGLTSITIPNGVTSFGPETFSGCSGLTSITIPNSVTNISSYTFAGCSGLTSVTIPDSVTTIGSHAFSGCSGLTSVTIGNHVKSIEGDAFHNCSNLSTVKWTAFDCTSAGSYSSPIFSDCSKLKTVTIDDVVETIPTYAFYNCTGLTTVTIGSGVTSIKYGAFSGCSGLTRITVSNGNTKYHSSGNCIIETFYKTLIMGCKSSVIPSDGSITCIGNGAFSGCSGLTSITIPDGVTSIGSGAFSDCSGLTSITIPDGVTSIGGGAFSGCSSLTSINIPNSVTSIEWGTFENCSGLTSVAIPNSVTSIIDGAFSGCSGLTRITVSNGNTKYHSSGNCIIETTSKTLIVGCKSSVIPTDGSVSSIGKGAFSGCSGLTSITIPNGVTSIIDGAFSGCNGLTRITVSNGNTKYHSSGNCIIETTSKTLIVGCKSSVIPTDGSVSSIGNGAFSGCSGLTSITIPNGVTKIGNSAFSGCSGLTSVIISTNVTRIGYRAFNDCSKLTAVTFRNTSDWFAAVSEGVNSGRTIAVTDASTNATYLTSTYRDFYWYRY